MELRTMASWNRSAKINSRIWITFLIVDSILLAGVLGWLYRDKLFSSFEQNPAQLRAALDQAENALGLLENERYEESASLLEDLIKNHPKDGSIAINLAIARLGIAQKTQEEIQGSEKLDEQQRQTLRNQLPELIGTAQSAAARAIELAPTQPEPYRIATLGKLEQAKLFEYPQDTEIKRAAVAGILEAFKQVPGDSVLTVKLLDLAEELSAESPDLAQQAADAALTAWKKLPRNLFLLQAAGQSLITINDARIGELIAPSEELAKPFMDQINANASGRDPLANIQKAKEQIVAGNLKEAEVALREWFNLLRGTASFLPDKRIADPNLLSMISLDGVNRWRVLLSKLEPNTSANGTANALQLTEIPLPSLNDTTTPIRYATWYDFDLDLTPDVAWIQGDQLRIAKLPTKKNDQWEVLSSIQVDSATSILYPIDLFGVVAGEQPKLSADQSKLKAASEAGGDQNEATAIIDRRHDTFQDLVLLSPKGIQVVTTQPKEPNSLERVLIQTATPTGLEKISNATRLEPIDWDADGDLDLAILANSKIQLWQNNGNRTFVSLDAWSTLLPDSATATSLVACDYDRDLDLDLLISCQEEKTFGVLENLLHSQFRWRALEGTWEQLGQASDLAVAELDGNASWDWCIMTPRGLQSLLTRTPAIGQVDATNVQSVDLKSANQQVAIADLNNDSWNDAVVWGAGGVTTIAGAGKGLFGSSSQGSSTILQDQKIHSVSIADSARNGQLALLIATDQGMKQYVANQAKPAGYMEVRLKGIDDVNGGGRINQYATGSVLELRAGERYMAHVVRNPMTHFGLGSVEKGNTLRVIFSNGLTQSVIDPPVNSMIEEKQAPKGSCPFLYGWDGEKFVMITDLLWNAPLGLQIARGKVLPDRRWEYILLPAEKMQPKDGNYELRITEELWEAAYFDEVRLIAVDHPADTEVFTNEKVGPPDIASPKIFTATNKRHPKKAIDSAGRDWTEAVSKRDAVYARGFTQSYCQGLVNKHFVELDFGKIPSHQSMQLILTGWLYPTDTSLNIGLDQNPDLGPPQPPSLLIADSNGEFQTLKPFMGFPGGKPKSIVIDITNAISEGDLKLRIETSAQLHWDEAFVVIDQKEVPLQEQPLPISSAELQYRGYSTLLPRAADQPHWYDYNQMSGTSGWPIMDGYFTRYGDVREILSADDDRMVVMGSGDEMRLVFPMPEKPLPDGWKRDFVLYSVGWDKDADLNTLEGQSSLPLPFKSMEAYPPPPRQEDTARKVWELNRDQLIRRQNFREFWRLSKDHLR